MSISSLLAVCYSGNRSISTFLTFEKGCNTISAWVDLSSPSVGPLMVVSSPAINFMDALDRKIKEQMYGADIQCLLLKLKTRIEHNSMAEAS